MAGPSFSGPAVNDRTAMEFPLFSTRTTHTRIDLEALQTRSRLHGNTIGSASTSENSGANETPPVRDEGNATLRSQNDFTSVPLGARPQGIVTASLDNRLSSWPSSDDEAGNTQQPRYHHTRYRLAALATERSSDDLTATPPTDAQQAPETEVPLLRVDDMIRYCTNRATSVFSAIANREPRSLLINQDYPEGKELQQTTMHIEIENPPPGGSVLIIQDIDIKWADTLLNRSDTPISPAFFARHMIRLESQNIHADAEKYLGRIKEEFNRRTSLKDEFSGHDWVEAKLWLDIPADDLSLHFDCDIGGMANSLASFIQPNFAQARRDTFEKHRSNHSHWRRTRTRLSWCQLRDNVYLILVDAMPDMAWGPDPMWSDSLRDRFQKTLSLRVDYKPALKVLQSPILVEHGHGSAECMLTTVKRLFQQHTPDSVFRPKYVPILDSTNPKIGHCHVFAWLLATSSWQAVVGNMESDLQRLQRNSANKANAEAFSQMRDFRRQVADAEVLLAECRQRLTVAMEGANEWAANGDDTQRIKRAFFWKTKKKRRQPTVSVSGRARSIDIKNLRVMLRMLEGKVNDMANTVNEEIQVVIGSVQVEDAQIMKQQTEVTVVLAVLAAIYLPLTLVTGIFGMNISDISDGNKPDRVWVVKTWSWIFSVTIALIATYASVRWLVHRIQKRRKRSKDKDMDLEALKMD